MKYLKKVIDFLFVTSKYPDVLNVLKNKIFGNTVFIFYSTLWAILNFYFFNVSSFQAVVYKQYFLLFFVLAAQFLWFWFPDKIAVHNGQEKLPNDIKSLHYWYIIICLNVNIFFGLLIRTIFSALDSSFEDSFMNVWYYQVILINGITILIYFIVKYFVWRIISRKTIAKRMFIYNTQEEDLKKRYLLAKNNGLVTEYEMLNSNLEKRILSYWKYDLNNKQDESTYTEYLENIYLLFENVSASVDRKVKKERIKYVKDLNNKLISDIYALKSQTPEIYKYLQNVSLSQEFLDKSFDELIILFDRLYWFLRNEDEVMLDEEAMTTINSIREGLLKIIDISNCKTDK